MSRPADMAIAEQVLNQACGPTVTVPSVSVGLASITAPTSSTSTLPTLCRGQLAQRFDGYGELPAGASLVPHSTDHTIDEQHRIVARLPRRRERAGRGRARVQPLPRLTSDDERVEVGQQEDPLVRLLRCLGVAGHRPCRYAVKVDAVQFAGQFVEQLDGPPRWDAEPFGEVLGRRWAVGK